MSLTIPADQLRDPLARRAFLESCAKVSFGLSVLPFFSKLAQAAEARALLRTLACQASAKLSVSSSFS